MKCALFFSLMLLASNADSASHPNAQQDQRGSGYTACFVDRADELDPLRPPFATASFFIAKIRVIGGPFWLRGRHGEVYYATKDVLGVNLKIETVVRGDVAVGAEYFVSFGEPGTGRSNICNYPRTPDQKTREYFVAGYVDENGKRRLLEAPISKALYDQWEREFWAYERERSRPGAQP